MELTPEMQEAITEFLKQNLRIETDTEYESGGVYLTVSVKLNNKEITTDSSRIYVGSCNHNNNNY